MFLRILNFWALYNALSPSEILSNIPAPPLWKFSSTFSHVKGISLSFDITGPHCAEHFPWFVAKPDQKWFTAFRCSNGATRASSTFHSNKWYVALQVRRARVYLTYGRQLKFTRLTTSKFIDIQSNIKPITSTADKCYKYICLEFLFYFCIWYYSTVT